jgi:glutathione S-transferase
MCLLLDLHTQQVPVLEHHGKVIAESLDLLSYLDANFEGPKLLPQGDTAKQAFAEELIGSSDPVIVALFRAGRAAAAAGAGAGGDDISELLAPALDKVEEALGRFPDGPFFLGQSMSAVSDQSSIKDMPDWLPCLISYLKKMYIIKSAL